MAQHPPHHPRANRQSSRGLPPWSKCGRGSLSSVLSIMRASAVMLASADDMIQLHWHRHQIATNSNGSTSFPLSPASPAEKSGETTQRVSAERYHMAGLGRNTTEFGYRQVMCTPTLDSRPQKIGRKYSNPPVRQGQIEPFNQNLSATHLCRDVF